MNPIYQLSEAEVDFQLSRLDRKTKTHLLEVANALRMAKEKHPEWPLDIVHCVAIINEEAGEATQAALDFAYKNKTLEGVNDEVVQTAAMCIRLLNFCGQFTQEQQENFRKNTTRPQR
jgi:NTP pyrophosphatase (non-canonical NTP hydrolase)